MLPSVPSLAVDKTSSALVASASSFAFISADLEACLSSALLASAEASLVESGLSLLCPERFDHSIEYPSISY